MPNSARCTLCARTALCSKRTFFTLPVAAIFRKLRAMPHSVSARSAACVTVTIPIASQSPAPTLPNRYSRYAEPRIFMPYTAAFSTSSVMSACAL